MKKFNEIITSESLEADFMSLADPQLSPDGDRERINDLVYNFVFKYIKRYFDSSSQVLDNHSADEVAEELGHYIKKATKLLGNQFALKIAAEMEHMSELSPIDRMLKMAEAGERLMTEFNKSDKTDTYPLQVIADLQCTAAMFKEVALGRVENPKEPAYGLDLGSGIGILMPAIVISAMRNKIADFLVVGVDHKPMAVENSRAALRTLLGSSFEVVESDFRDEKVNYWKQDRKLTHWVSETINPNIPKLDFDKPNLGVVEDRFSKHMNGIDPYPVVLAQAKEHMPNMRDLAKRSELYVFPNPLTGNYEPSQEGGMMRLESSSAPWHLPLGEMNYEFRDYPNLPLASHRFDDPEASEEINESYMRFVMGGDL